MFPYFTTEADIKAAGVPITADVKIPMLEPYYYAAEHYLVQAIGYDQLDQVHDGTVPAQLLALVKRVIALVAVRGLASINQRLTTSTGTSALAGTKDTTSTKELIQLHLDALSAQAEEALEAVLQFLDEHPAQCHSWATSRYCTVYPRRYFQNIEQLREYPGAPANRQAFRKAQGALQVLTAQRVLRVIGPELNTRLVQELDAPEHAEVLGYIRTALAAYLVGADLHAAECALVELRWLLQRSPEAYPEFLSSPSYVPTEIGPMTTTNAYVAF